MRLQNNNVTVIYNKGSNMYFADTLSRAHTTNIEPNYLYDADILVASIEINTSMIDLIKTVREKDIALQEVIKYTMTGWPINNKDIPDEVKLVFTYKDEITVDKIILKGNQIIIPKGYKNIFWRNYINPTWGLSDANNWLETMYFGQV